MFTIKICGITRPEDAQAAADAGADAIGLNFYEMSPRFVDADRARAIIAELPQHVIKVGLFVNARPKEVCRLYDDLKLDLIQLHGDEPPESLTAFGGRPLMKAFGVEVNGLSSIISYLIVSRHIGCLPRLVLLDAPRRHSYGGSGKLADWSLAKAYQSYERLDDALRSLLAGGSPPEKLAEAIRAAAVQAFNTRSGLASQPGIKDAVVMAAFAREGQLLDDTPPLVLAGGLTAENVAEAIRATGVRAVDTASGVESQPGIKDAAAIAAFVAAARNALAPA
jgi:phosphoribosylanthranilate isomerase